MKVIDVISILTVGFRREFIGWEWYDYNVLGSTWNSSREFSWKRRNHIWRVSSTCWTGTYHTTFVELNTDDICSSVFLFISENQ